MSITQRQIGFFQDHPVIEYQLTNSQGARVSMLNLGATLREIAVADRNGKIDNILLGYDDLQGYLDDPFYMGIVVGRFANRIANGQFRLDGNTYQLTCNQAPNHLHGGESGFHRKLWKVETLTEHQGQGLMFSTRSLDGEEGYPGNMDIRLKYLLTDDNQLRMDFQAECDQATPVSFTQHPYFNLAAGGDIGQHIVQINADAIVPTDALGIPTGELLSVKDNAFDFTVAKAVASGLDQQHPQQILAKGYDHNYAVNSSCREMQIPVAKVSEPVTGRLLEVYSNQPGVQFYSGNYLGGRFAPYSGLCLEPQAFPDAPNQANFPSAILYPGQTYQHKMLYSFSVDD
ncbi:aldose epimerase family protein [Neptunicella sp. SCSIO 80796]|uniref:aldose epimerase family protein n=1 Tax=Neptunicella plasticusilytica TaxID=3117012 RepID=UPI003A4E2494